MESHSILIAEAIMTCVVTIKQDIKAVIDPNNAIQYYSR